jgi:hypothetical protein
LLSMGGRRRLREVDSSALLPVLFRHKLQRRPRRPRRPPTCECHTLQAPVTPCRPRRPRRPPTCESHTPQAPVTPCLHVGGSRRPRRLLHLTCGAIPLLTGMIQQDHGNRVGGLTLPVDGAGRGGQAAAAAAQDGQAQTVAAETGRSAAEMAGQAAPVIGSRGGTAAGAVAGRKACRVVFKSVVRQSTTDIRSKHW